MCGYIDTQVCTYVSVYLSGPNSVGTEPIVPNG